ncbi:hypothetical protein [Streptomyces sp. S186]
MVEDAVHQLRGEDEVEAHLRQRDAGALTIAYTTPVVYATFRRP